MRTNRYRLSQLKLDVKESPNNIPKIIARKFGKGDMIVTDVEIIRRSIDARRKSNIKQVFTVDFSTDKVLDLPEPKQEKYQEVPSGTEKLAKRPIVVGFGPCGMFAALTLAYRGYRPIVLERGYDMDSRIKEVQRFWKKGILNPECNVQFGEGGAGTFSDGKLTTGIKDPRIRIVLEELVKAGHRYRHAPLHRKKPAL